MSKKARDEKGFTPCPCDEAPYPWCNNAEGCDTCADYERWLEENDLD